MTQGSDKEVRDPEEDVVQAAEAYFKKFEIKALLTQILVKLGEERPEDPAKAIRSHLELSERQRKEGSEGSPNRCSALTKVGTDLVPDEEHDADTSLFQAPGHGVKQHTVAQSSTA